MVAIYILVLVFLLIYTGLGLPLALRLRVSWPETLFAAFFIGWGCTLTVLQVWHLVLPVNSLALLVAIILSLSFWGWKGRPVMQWIWKLPRTLPFLFIIIASGLLFLLVNQSLYSPNSYDHGLYHVPTIRWIQAFPIVPGLGNLHHRLAFNNASMLVIAMMDSGPLQGLIYYTTTTLLFSVLAFRGLLGAYRSAQGVSSLREGFFTLLLPVLLWYVTEKEHVYAGYSTDSMIFVIQAFLAAEFLYFIEQVQPSDSQRDRRAQALLLLFYVFIGLVVKLSFAIYGIGIFLAVAWGWIHGNKTSTQENWSILKLAAGIGSIVLVPWLVRNAILSGYLLFPSTVIAFPFRWTIPEDLARSIAIVIKIWARTGGVFAPDLPFNQWFQLWWSHRSFEFKEIWMYTALMLIAVAVLRLTMRSSTRDSHGLSLLLLVVSTSLLYWFFTAPAIRFASALLWILPLIPMLMLIQHARRLSWLRFPNAAVAIFVFSILLWLQPNFTNNLSRSWLLFPRRETELAADLMHYDRLRYQETDSGLKVIIAADEFEERCFDQPLPCTRLHEFDRRLSLIEPGNIGAGFWMETKDP